MVHPNDWYLSRSPQMVMKLLRLFKSHLKKMKTKKKVKNRKIVLKKKRRMSEKRLIVM
jgi:hypothetical protein